ncbi:MAG: phosphopyruvate hydratase [bacterium]|nr:phosphopyruvate hydratase [bacterium]
MKQKRSLPIEKSPNMSITSSKIFSVHSREILDSRGEPTLETLVILESGYRGTSSVPAGTSLGKYEALELRDKDPNRYGGMGVLSAVKNVNTLIAEKLKGLDALDQGLIDKTLIALDGTPNKQTLGSNSILSVSLATAQAASAQRKLQPYEYLHTLMESRLPGKIARMPTPIFNVINGGLHGAGNLNFQEFWVIPATSTSYHEALRMGEEIYHAVKKILIYRNAVHSVGDEGGFAPNLFTNLDAMEILVESLRTTPYKLGVNVFLGLDLAASHFKTDHGYLIKDRPSAFSPKEFIQYLKKLHNTYNLLILEDPLDEDDWAGWAELTALIGKEVLVVGDDLLATNAERLTKAVAEKACSAILLKPNQIGTLTEFLDVVAIAKKNAINCIVSHRSGETTDTCISDLAVAVNADYVKFGAPARGERVAKYNRLLQIESELFP